MDISKECNRKVLFVLEGWNNAGTESYVSFLIEQIVKRSEFTPVVLLLSQADSNESQRIKNLGVEFIQPGAEGWSIKALKEKIIDINPCIIHNHLYLSAFRFVLFEKLFLNGSIVTTFHLPLSQWNIIHKVQWYLAATFSNYVIGAAGAVSGEFSKFRRVRDKIQTINPPVTVRQREGFVKSVEAQPDEAWIITGVGRLANKQKDWLTLIKAYQLFKHNHRESKSLLRIVGGGPDEQVLKSAIEALGLCSSIELTGHVPQSQVSEYLAEADLFVLPSRFEGFGIAPVEAMQMGIPVITSNYPASFDYIDDGKTGFHFPIGDASALAEKIEYCYLNREKVGSVAKAGRKFACEKFAPEKIAAQHIEIYNRLLSAKTP